MKPNVLCVGFAKCGTTTLYDILKQHPDIYLSSIKEPIFYGSNLEKRGYGWYQNRYYPKANNSKIVMEINPILGRDIDPNIIKRDFGNNMKIIFIVRNPIDRLYSEFRMNLIDGTCFHNIKDNLGNSTSEMMRRWINDNFFYENNMLKIRQSYSTDFCTSGNYDEKIKKYIDVFGRENIYVMFFEDFVKNPQIECEKIYKFIGVDCSEDINYYLHSNDGNRLPKSEFTIKANQIWFLKIWKQIIIEKLPYISDDFSTILNNIAWNMPILLSKKNINREQLDEESRKILELYYSNMILNLSEILEIDLFEKWNIHDSGKKLIRKKK